MANERKRLGIYASRSEMGDYYAFILFLAEYETVIFQDPNQEAYSVDVPFSEFCRQLWNDELRRIGS